MLGRGVPGDPLCYIPVSLLSRLFCQGLVQRPKGQPVPGPEENQVVPFPIHFKGCVANSHGHLGVNGIMDSDSLSLVLLFIRSLGLVFQLRLLGTVFAALA